MKIPKLLYILLLPLACCFSCNKFLDVTADSAVIEQDLFKEPSGYHIAVNGVYRTLSGTSLYGRHLTWGFVSGMGGNYEITTSLPQEVRYGAEFNWEVAGVETALDSIWSKGYYVIANVNNIIQHTESRDSSFFTHGAMEKNLILGEMYGLRAMMHFDLMRIFNPAPLTGYSGGAIPYVEHYPEPQPQARSTDEVYAAIIRDMEMAQSLLAPIDTSATALRSIMSSPSGRIRQVGSWVNTPYGDFFNFRAQRINYFAATALLARIHLYLNDFEEARKNAQIVYDFQKRNWFRWTSSTYQGQIADVDYIHVKRPDELLLTFSNNNNYEIYEGLIGQGIISNTAFRMNSMDILFENDLDDYRRVGWYNRHGDQRYLTWSRPRGTSSTAQGVVNNQGPLLPVIRFSEMYHILIECMLRDGQVEEAVGILNDLRTNRGAKRRIASDIPAGELMEVLVNDVIRETLTEGQTFFMFKRLGRDIFYGNTSRVMAPDDWYAPIPQSEQAYQF